MAGPAAASGLAGLGLGGCSMLPSFRYKLTLAVATPEGVRSAFNVVEISHGAVIFPNSGGIMTHARGEALYLDLGPGRRPLVALLTRDVGEKHREPKRTWGEVTPFRVLARVYGERFAVTDGYGNKGSYLGIIAKHRGAKEITTNDLPDLVTFADVTDPKSVMAVDPGDLAATLGPGVSWHRLTIEITDEPLTTGIEKRLGWVAGPSHVLDRSVLDHQRRNGIYDTLPLSNRLTTWSFIRRQR